MGSTPKHELNTCFQFPKLLLESAVTAVRPSWWMLSEPTPQPFPQRSPTRGFSESSKVEAHLPETSLSPMEVPFNVFSYPEFRTSSSKTKRKKKGLSKLMSSCAFISRINNYVQRLCSVNPYLEKKMTFFSKIHWICSVAAVLPRRTLCTLLFRDC